MKFEVLGVYVYVCVRSVVGNRKYHVKVIDRNLARNSDKI